MTELPPVNMYHFPLICFREGGELMTGGTKRKITVSTIMEAEFYAENGFEDILFASPIVKERISR